MFIIFSFVVLIFFSIASSKLPNYIVPALPGFAIIIAVIFDTYEIKRLFLWNISGYLSAAMIGMIGTFFFALPFIYSHLHKLNPAITQKIQALAENFDIGYWGQKGD